MHSFVALLSPLALLLPAAAAELPGAAPGDEIAHEAPDVAAPPMGFDGSASHAFKVMEQAREVPVERQVRIDQRVIIRIAPSQPGTFEQLMGNPPRRTLPQRFEEEKIEGCVPIGAIAAVQPSQQNRLLLFMRDRRILSAALEKACNSAEFYSGFYVERSKDGELCTRRDRLQSRAGASCRVTKLSRLVAVRD